MYVYMLVWCSGFFRSPPHTAVCAHLGTYAYTYLYVYVKMCLLVCLNIYIYIHTHTHTYMHIDICSLWIWVFSHLSRITASSCIVEVCTKHKMICKWSAWKFLHLLALLCKYVYMYVRLCTYIQFCLTPFCPVHLGICQGDVCTFQGDLCTYPSRHACATWRKNPQNNFLVRICTRCIFTHRMKTSMRAVDAHEGPCAGDAHRLVLTKVHGPPRLWNTRIMYAILATWSCHWHKSTWTQCAVKLTAMTVYFMLLMGTITGAADNTPGGAMVSAVSRRLYI